VLNKEFKVAQYGQWDGYPSGQGETVLKFLQSCDLKSFTEQVSKLKEFTTEEVMALCVECGADDKGDMDHEASKTFYSKYPYLSRDAGATILQMIADDTVDGVRLYTGFAGDSLFCEWAYVIDLDNNRLEVMKGFQTEPNKDRFAEFFEENDRDTQYYPVALKAFFSLDDLPEYEVFLEMCEVRDEDDEDDD